MTDRSPLVIGSDGRPTNLPTGDRLKRLVATSVDNTIPRFDGTAGALQTSGVAVDDSDNVTGVAALTCSGVLTALRAASSASTEYGAKVQLTQSGAGIGYGLDVYMLASGAGAAASGASVYARAATMNGSRDHIVALQGLSSHNSTGTLTDLLGASIFLACDPGTGAVTNAKGVEVNTPTIGGTVTNLYGLYVHPMSGAGDNYSIYTNAGKARFGGDVYIASGFGLYIASNVRIAGTGTVTNFYSGSTSLGFYSQDGATQFGAFANATGTLALTAGLTFGNETLSTYDEGDWTVTLSASGTAGSHTYSTRVGRYVRIGKFVFVTGSIIVSSKDAAINGTIRISGFPFPVKNLAGFNPSGSFSYTQHLAFGAQLGLNLTPATSYADLVDLSNTVGGFSAGVTQAALGANPGVTFSICYEVD